MPWWAWLIFMIVATPFLFGFKIEWGGSDKKLVDEVAEEIAIARRNAGDNLTQHLVINSFEEGMSQILKRHYRKFEVKRFTEKCHAKV